MVRPAVAGADSSSNRRYAAEADRAGHGRAVHAMAVALATYRTGIPSWRRAGSAGSFTPAARVRDSRERMGEAGSGAPDRRLRSAMAGPALPDRRGGLGTAFAASGDARRFGGRQAARDPDQRGADHVLCA